jgi:hypothetical protein
VSEKQVNEPILALQQPKQKSSAYKGVCKHPLRSRYIAQIYGKSKRHGIGYYQLESDAALAYDEAAKLLKGPSSKLNFKTRNDHIEAREREIQQRGFVLDQSEAYGPVCQRIKEYTERMMAKCNAESPEVSHGALFSLFCLHLNSSSVDVLNLLFCHISQIATIIVVRGKWIFHRTGNNR